MQEFFRRFAQRTSRLAGTPWAFFLALAMILVWAGTGPLFHFSDTWQLIINTATTIVTFLMVFLIQNTQNRDARAMHLKLDELVRASREARTGMIDVENLSDEELEQLHREFQELLRHKELESRLALTGADRRVTGRRVEDRVRAEEE